MASKPNSSVQKEDPKTRGYLARAFGWVLGFLVYMWISAFFAIVLECGGALLGIWHLPTAAHAKQQIDLELGYLAQFTSASPMLNEYATTLTRFIFVWTGLGPGIGLATALVRELGPEPAAMADAAMSATQLVSIRAVISVLTLPLFILVGAVATVDGLVMRELRKFRAGHESSLVHHIAHRHIKPMVVIPWILYMSDPFSIHPNWIFIPCLCLFGTAIAIAMAKFKKVL